MSDSTAAPLRVGVIGAGANTQLRHIPGFQALPNVEVAAVCNRTEASSRRVAEEFGIARVAASPAALLADPAIDAICIGVWPYRHREFTVMALEAGKHVLCEARMAMDMAEARVMLRAARAHPHLVAQLAPAPFDLPCWRTVRRLIEEGELGRIFEVHVTALSGAALATDTPAHWREQTRYSGANVMSLGIYAEIIDRWLGPAAWAVADATTFITSRPDRESAAPISLDVPDSLTVLGGLERGGRVVYRMSTVAPATAEEQGITIFGSDATLRWRPEGTLTLTPHGQESAMLAADLDPVTDAPYGWSVERDFVDAIRTGAPVLLTDFEAGLRYMEFTEAVWRSWTERRFIDLASLRAERE